MTDISDIIKRAQADGEAVIATAHRARVERNGFFFFAVCAFTKKKGKPP
jgi:hypothetical protein